MRVWTACFVLCAIGLVSADDAKKEATSLKGKWSAVSLKQGGQATPDDILTTYKFAFEEKTYSITVGGEVQEDGNYKIDDSKSPKTIDFEIKKGQDDGKKQLGIFKLEGDKLTIVAAKAGSTERPASFKVEDGSDLVEAVVERAKP